MMTVVPGFMAETAPPSPNITLSTCSALTTSTTMMEQRAGKFGWRLRPGGSLRDEACTTAGRTSQTVTGKPLRSSDLATPPPIDPSPITPTLGLLICILPQRALFCFQATLEHFAGR